MNGNGFTAKARREANGKGAKASILALLLLVNPLAAAGQEIRGTVSLVGEPVAGALLALVDGDSAIRATTVSDPAGAFRLRGPVGTTVKLRVERLGLSTIESVPVSMQNGDTLHLEIRMRPAPLALEGVEVTGTMQSELRRFLDRRANGFGRTFIREEIAALGPTSTDALLASLPGSFLLPAAAGSIVARSRDPFNPICAPHVYVDGLEMPSETADPTTRDVGVPIGSWVSHDDIMGVEIYRIASQAPPEYQRPFMRDCTVVLIWTNQSFGVGR